MHKFLLAGLVFLTTACSIDGNITDMTVRKKVMVYSPTSGITAGAILQTTGGGYYAEVSVGDTYSSVSDVTTGGYVAYSNIQGIIVSEGSELVAVE